MDYEEFNKEYKKYEMWNDDNEYSEATDGLLWGNDRINFINTRLPGANSPDTISFKTDEPSFSRNNYFASYKPFIPDDRVNSPSHYTSGKQEAIDIIEDAISVAPSPQKGFLQAQVLKYLLRLWLKDDPSEDARKAQWYLKRLIKSLE